LTAANATGSDKTLTLPNETGTILTTASSIANSNLANSAVTIGSTSVSLGATTQTFIGINSLASGTLIAGVEDAANAIEIGGGNIIFEGSTADGNEIILTAADASGSDKTITLPNATGTVALLNTLSVASGSGLTYNSGTGEFSTNAIPNSKLANSSVTVGSTAIALGGSSTTLTGLSSVTSTAVVTNDSGFRIRNNSDNTKIGAFSSASITGGQTRTLTFPDADGTIATQSYVNSQISAEDLDVETDSGNFDVDLNSEALTIAGGTGIDSSGSGTTATIAIDSTVATLTGSQTLTNKTIVLGNNTVSGALANGITATTQSASDNSTKVATTAYVDNQVTAGATNEFADNVFRVKDNSDASKKLAFECSGISGSTTRTMTVPNTDGTISTESFATAIAVALG